MKSILFIHQSAELYGSDKTLLLLIEGLKERKNINLIVVLPERGPLYDILITQQITTIIAPVLKISRKMFSVKNIFSLPLQIRRSFAILDDATRDINIDVIYSNTLAVLLGLMYAKIRGLKHVWHIHEIIEKPAIVHKIFLRLINSSANSMSIYNSVATKNFWQRDQAIKKNKSLVVWNGMSEPRVHLTLTEIAMFRNTKLHVNNETILIALVGRVNRWKGQLLLLEVFEKLVLKYDNIKLLFVGSAPPGQEEYIYSLQQKIKSPELTEKVILLPFHTNIWEVWDSIDIAVVPSIEPEPFGLVALEAMLCAKPVIAANHGGLAEIVVDEETGLLFEPNNSVVLERALEQLILRADKRILYGKKGYSRAIEKFTLDQYITQIEAACLSV
jgi:glycosyltransferase involved in cell wall biosynthesis